MFLESNKKQYGLYFHYYQEGNILNDLERITCAFFLSIKTGYFSKNLRMKSSVNYGLAAGFNTTGNTFAVIVLFQCFPICKQESAATSPKQPTQSKKATILKKYFPTL